MIRTTEQKLQLLKEVEPSQSTLARIKMKAMADREKEEQAWYRQSQFAYIALACVVLSIGLIISIPSNRQVGFALMTKAKITASRNEFEKTKLALAYATVRLNESNPSAIDDLLAQQTAASEANTYLESLNLAGEPGKYTKDDCRALYRQYETYLDRYETALQGISLTSPEKITARQQVLQQLASYRQSAESRWQL